MDLTCGSGKHLIRLLNMGFDVEGVDASETMLANCRRKAGEQGLAPVLYKQSMQTLDLPCRYATIFVSEGSFQLLDDRERAVESLGCFRRHLAPGGQLLICTFLPDEARDFNYSQPKATWGPYTRIRDGATILTHLWTDHVNHFEQVKIESRRYEAWLGGTVIESELHAMHLRWYYQHEFAMMLEKAGFISLFPFGDYSDSRANEETGTVTWKATH